VHLENVPAVIIVNCPLRVIDKERLMNRLKNGTPMVGMPGSPARLQCEREDKFLGLKQDAWYHKIIEKFTTEDHRIIRDFFRAHGGLDIGQYERVVQRLFLDKPYKPKNWTSINEVLIVCGKVEGSK
jgi:hypothetical protein